MGKSPKKAREVAAAPRAAVTREPILSRLQVLQRAADRSGRHVESEAINRVIIGVSDAKQKAREAIGVVCSDVAAILDELENL